MQRRLKSNAPNITRLQCHMNPSEIIQIYQFYAQETCIVVIINVESSCAA